MKIVNGIGHGLSVHQTLAREMGTTRVVVSRILKQFEKNKKVKLYRGATELCS